MVGRTLGHYRIEEKIGAGGMGEVYRARDTRLGRDVAIKVLPEALARDPERLARFEREAQLLASLNHPNIAAIYDLEESNGVRFLVLEFVAGETLAGPRPVEEALAICRQIAEALEAAHEKGVVHRDLKPANIKVTPEGKVKVLDFGLAKAFAEEPSSADLSQSPTLTAAATRAGVILGTAAYMSPEQARGKPVDKRTDIWAFGCVLYELLTGRQGFGGETVSDSVAKILARDPEWQSLPDGVPGNIQVLLRKCLQRDAHRRLQAIGDARIELEEPGSFAAPAVPLARPSNQWLLWAVGSLVVILAGVVVWALFRLAAPAPQPLTRVVVALPPGVRLAPGRVTGVTISPEGTRLVYVAGHGASAQLYVRSMERFEAQPIPGTEGAEGPFFSPDGQWVGFFGEGKLKKVSLSGGSPVTLCEAPTARGATWGPDDSIIFTPLPAGGLLRVPAGGGAPQELTIPGPEELGHRWPEILPGGKTLVYTAWTPAARVDDARIWLYSIETKERRLLIEGGACARYSPTGHLVYGRAGGLLAVPFDLARLRVTGPPVPVLEDVATNGATGSAQFSVSRTGALVYIAGGARATDRTLVWVDRKGTARPIPAPPRAYNQPRLSPDGRRLAVGVEAGRSPGVWLYDLARDSLAFLAGSTSAGNPFPVWTPDGKRVTFRAARAGRLNLLWIAADGSGSAEALTTSPNLQYPGSWSPDGQALGYTEFDRKTGLDVWVLPLDRDRQPRPLIRTPANEGGAIFSPDGRWLGYTSNESGHEEVYMQPYPGPGAKIQISIEGGIEPVWARNGREIFYRSGDKMMAVPVTTEPKFSAAKPNLLFEGRYEKASWAFTANYDVAPDGQRFLMIKGSEESVPTQLNLVLNWFEELKRRVPAGKK